MITAEPFRAIWKGREAGSHSIFFRRARLPSNFRMNDCIVPPLIQMTFRTGLQGATSILSIVLHLLYSIRSFCELGVVLALELDELGDDGEDGGLVTGTSGRRRR